MPTTRPSQATTRLKITIPIDYAITMRRLMAKRSDFRYESLLLDFWQIGSQVVASEAMTMTIRGTIYPVRTTPMPEWPGSRGVAHIQCHVPVQFIEILDELQAQLGIESRAELVRWMVQYLAPAIEARTSSSAVLLTRTDGTYRWLSRW